MSDEHPNDLVRVSNLDRERVMGILQEAFSEGRLTIDEYTDRCGVALAAKTVGDLRPLLTDLPVTYAGGATAAPVSGEVVEWKGTFGSLKRTGAWPVPAKIILVRRMGSVELDFTQAQFTSASVEIELDIIGGSVEIRVPDGTDVLTDDVEVVLGSVEDHRRTRGPGTGPSIRFSGTLRAGSLEVRGPKRRLFR